METYVITIRPESPFGTPLKGDTLFGQFCWQLAETGGLLNRSLDDWIREYPKRPFAVFSSAWPRISRGDRCVYAVRRPELPQSILGDPEGVKKCRERLEMRKKNRARRWLLVSEDLRSEVTWENLVDDKAVFHDLLDSQDGHGKGVPSYIPPYRQRPMIVEEQQHNTINRLTMTTGTGMFAPYAMENTFFFPGMELVVFVAVDTEALDEDGLRASMELMGKWGFGRDASTGLGRFSLMAMEKVSWPTHKEGQWLLTLGPCVPEKGVYEEMFFVPFTRFGRHGPQLIHTGKPFKNPVVMADEGAVFVPNANWHVRRPFIGRAVAGVSKAMPETVVQGYTLVLPFECPVEEEKP